MVAAAGALVAGWVLLAPPSIGGKTLYSITYGTSMLPKLHKGDLVVVRKTSTFKVGDVALYENLDLKRRVLHRVLRIDGDRYAMKGDNNGFVDTFEPSRKEMLGTLWFKVGGVGNAGTWLGEPSHAAIVTGVVALLSLLGSGLKADRARRRRRGAKQRGAAAGGRKGAFAAGGLGGGRGGNGRGGSGGGGTGGLVPGQAAQVAGGVLALVALLCGLLAAISFGKSTTRLGDGPAVYAQHGSFAYEAQVPSGAVYEDGKVTTGQPAYVKIVRSLKVTFSYRLDTKAEHQAFGSTALVAELANGSGWTRTFQLAPRTPFTSDTAKVSGILHLTALRAIADQLEAVTGQVPDTYTVTIRPSVRLGGTLAGAPLKDEFAPPLALALDRYKLALPTSGSADTALVRDQDGPASKQLVQRSIALAGLKLEVATARRLATVIGLAALVGALGVGLLFLLGLRRSDEPARIRARFGHLIVEIVEPRRRFPEHDIVMASFEDLVRVSDRHARMILHAQAGDRHVWLVEDDGVAYRYEAQGRAAAGDGRAPTVLGGDPPAPPAGPAATPPADRSPARG